jgi:hypothetical protein
VGKLAVIAIGGVLNFCVASVASFAPLIASMPGSTVTVYSVACGKRGIAVNWMTRVSIQRHSPLTAGEIVIFGSVAVPTAATATIGSENRTRISDSARMSPCGVICGEARGDAALPALPAVIGASVTALPVGTTNAIGCTGPERGGGIDDGRTVGAFVFAPERSGNGSIRVERLGVGVGEVRDRNVRGGDARVERLGRQRSAGRLGIDLDLWSPGGGGPGRDRYGRVDGVTDGWLRGGGRRRATASRRDRASQPHTDQSVT